MTHAEVAAVFTRGIVVRVQQRTPRTFRDATLALPAGFLTGPAARAIDRYRLRVPRFMTGHGFWIPRYMSRAYFLPNAEVEPTVAWLDAAIDDHDTRLVPAWLRVYTAAQPRTTGQATRPEADEPILRRLRAACVLRYTTVDWQIPEHLAQIAPACYRAQRAVLTHQRAVAARDMRDTLRRYLYERLATLYRQITYTQPETGLLLKPHGAATLKQLGTYGTRFPSWNVTDDTALAALVEEVRQIVTGVEMFLVRHDEIYRAEVAARVSAVMTRLRPMFTKAPRAKFLYRQGSTAASRQRDGQTGTSVATNPHALVR